jgi:predicted lipid-binding transport protein (Tim44 family)
MFIPPPNPEVGKTAGSIAGGLAGGALLGMFDGPLPILDTIGGENAKV